MRSRNRGENPRVQMNALRLMSSSLLMRYKVLACCSSWLAGSRGSRCWRWIRA